jgi:hypothetical protein
MKKLAAAVRILLDLQKLDADPQARADLNTNIAALAPSSPLYAKQAVKDEVANLGTTFTALKAARKTAAASAAQHKLDVEAENAAMLANNKSLSLLRTLTENGALTPADAKSMGFDPYEGPPPKPDLTVAPLQIDVELGKRPHQGQGSAKASVHESATEPRRHYAAQSSTDGVTWVDLVGHGKSRRLTGKSGTSIFVRFALERGSQRSPWSNAVQITFP